MEGPQFGFLLKNPAEFCAARKITSESGTADIMDNLEAPLTDWGYYIDGAGKEPSLEKEKERRNKVQQRVQ